jgi:putative flippase GtrA
MSLGRGSVEKKVIFVSNVVAAIKQAAPAPLVQQFLRFACVGLAATVVHFAILITLVEIWHFGPVFATTIGFAVGALISYALNRRYTFGPTGQFGLGLAKYYGALSVGLLLNGIIVGVLSGAGLPYLVAQGIATGTVLIWNFLTARLLVFRDAA